MCSNDRLSATPPFAPRLESPSEWGPAVLFSVLLVLSLVATVPVATADDTELINEGAVETLDSAPIALEDRSGEAELSPTLEQQASTGEEVTVVLRLTELRDQDQPRFAAAVDRPDVSVRDELESHAAATQSTVNAELDRRPGVEVKNDFWITNAIVVTVDTSRVDLEDLTDLPHVERIHENFEVQSIGATIDSPVGHADSLESAHSGPTIDDSSESISAESSGYTYGLEQINAPDVWAEFDNRGEGVTVAVLDTGVDVASHSDLELIEDGWAEFDDDGTLNESEPYDPNGHGTHVAGTVGGDLTDKGDHYGVAPDVGLAHAKVLNKTGSGSFIAILSGMQWAIGHEEEFDVLSMSLGADAYVEEFIDPVENARDAGIVVIAAAGNSGEETSSSPANVYDVIAVGASDANEEIASFSGGEVIDTDEAWGPDARDHWPDEYVVPDVAAPGVAVESAVPGGGYDAFEGTSMATPHVTGAVTLMLSENPDLSVDDVKAILEHTASHPESVGEQDTRYGYGIIDAYAAVSVASGDAYVEGIVVDHDGVPVADAPVAVDGVEQLETTDNGLYAVVVDPGERTLSATLPGYTEASTTVSLAGGEMKTIGELQIAELADLSGTVTSSGDSEPIENATVVLTAAGSQVEEAETDSQGVYAIGDVAPGEYTLTVSADGFVTSERSIDLEPGTDEIEDVVLEPDEPSVADYADDDGVVRTDGLRDAIDDWRSGAIGTDLLRDVIDAWRSGESVDEA